MAKKQVAKGQKANKIVFGDDYKTTMVSLSIVRQIKVFLGGFIRI